MLAIIQSKVFRLPVSYKKSKMKIYRLWFWHVCCMGAKLGLLLWGRNTDWGFL